MNSGNRWLLPLQFFDGAQDTRAAAGIARGRGNPRRQDHLIQRVGQNRSAEQGDVAAPAHRVMQVVAAPRRQREYVGR